MKRIWRKPSGLDYSTLTPVQVYDHVVSGTIKTFPNGYVVPENMKPILREVVLNRLKLTRQEICDKLSYNYLRPFSISGSRKAFNDNIYDLITYCFPEFEIKYWELKKVQNAFWQQEENRKEFMLWVANKENIDVNSIESIKRIDADMIQKYGGSKPLVHGGGLYNLILLIAKIDVKEWEVIKMREWTDEKVRDAVKWLIEEKLGWSEEEVVNKMSARVFRKYNLDGMLQKHCNHSPLKALQIAYPGKYTRLKNVRPDFLRKK